MVQDLYPSFWQRQSLPGHSDVIILGGGIVGLSAAISLKERHPAKKVSLLEQGPLPMGASVKNAGFACYGSPSELLDDLKHSSENDVFALVERRYRGLQLLRQRLGDLNIGYEASGGWEIFSPGEEASYQACDDSLAYLNERLHEITGKNVYENAGSRIADFGFSGVQHMIFNSGEGLIDSGRMMQSLYRFALEKGIFFVGGAKVTAWEPDRNGVKISDSSGRTYSAGQLLICTNGYAHRLLPGELFPARAQVLLTKPLSNVPFAGGFHFEQGYYYFRNLGNRVLFGGGRNLDFKGEETDEQGLTDTIQHQLEMHLRERILPGREFEIEMRWSGTMGVGPVKSPIIRELEPGVFCAVRMGGMGVALGSLVGEEAAERMGI